MCQEFTTFLDSQTLSHFSGDYCIRRGGARDCHAPFSVSGRVGGDPEAAKRVLPPESELEQVRKGSKGVRRPLCARWAHHPVPGPAQSRGGSGSGSPYPLPRGPRTSHPASLSSCTFSQTGFCCTEPTTLAGPGPVTAPLPPWPDGQLGLLDNRLVNTAEQGGAGTAEGSPGRGPSPAGTRQAP